MTTLNDLIQKCTPLSDVISVRRSEHNAYSINTEGAVNALYFSGSDEEYITLDDTAQDLEYLCLSGNKSLKEVSFNGYMNRLKHLDISDSGLMFFTIPESCRALEQVYVQGNQLSNLIFQGECPQLQLLDASRNQLTDVHIPYGMNRLAYLYLNDNQLTHTHFCEQLNALEILHLRNNQLKELTLPNNVFKSDSPLETLYLHNNPSLELPKELISEDERGNSLDKVKSYLRELSKDTVVNINERAKLIIVGNGRVGKTSLYRRLKNKPYDSKEKYTHGIKLRSLNKQSLPKVKTPNLQLSVWDFGGQEIFYATHQFFLSDEAIYVLAWTNEKNVEAHRERDKQDLPTDAGGEKWRDCDYWLDNIRFHGKNSPIVMVQTHYDCRANRLDEAENWKKEYQAEWIHFSASSDFGLDELKEVIIENLEDKIQMFGKPFPTTWNTVIDAITAVKKTEISLTEFKDICKKAQITEGGEMDVLDYLHKTGVVVYFDADNLRDTIYTDPNWLTEEVYRLINNELHDKKGKIDTAYLTKILNIHIKEKRSYTQEERMRFIDLLMKFKLIFKAKEGLYIAPQYLPEELEEGMNVLFNGILERLSLSFVFRFPKFVPDNVMINFLSMKGEFSNKFYWRHGIYFKEDGQDCIVLFDEKTKSLTVYTDDTVDNKSFQAKICQEFVILSKNTNAEISVDGQAFANWHELKKQADLYDKNPNQQFFAVDGTPLSIKDFAVFLGKENILGHFNYDRGGIMRIPKDLIPNDKPLEISKAKDARIFLSFNDTQEAIKILFLAATPMRAAKLNTGLESRFKDLIRYFDTEKRFQFQEEHGVTPEQFQNFLIFDDPHIVHYGGHGEEEGIVLEGENLEADILAGILQLSSKTQCVVLNACNSLSIAKSIAAHIPYVVATQAPIGDATAIAFAKGFYMGLVAGKTVEQSFQLGLLTIRREKLSGVDIPVLVKGV